MVVEEISSPLRPVNKTLRTTNDDSILCVNPILSLMNSYYILQPDKTLGVVTDEPKERKKQHDLDELTKEILFRLRSGLDKSFFGRYHPILSRS